MTIAVDHYQYLDCIQQDHIRELINRAHHYDEIEPVSEHTLLSLSSDQAHHLLVHTHNHHLVGYLHYSSLPQHSYWVGECVVDPQYRRRGIGTTLIHQAETLTENNIRLWAHGTLSAAQKLAEKLALSPVRTLLQMDRPLQYLPPQIRSPVLPENIYIRCYRDESDDKEILRVNNAAFQWHPEQGHWNHADLVSRYQADWFDPAGLFLAYDRQGLLRGFHWTKIHPCPSGVGEVYIVGIDPSVQGQGIGTSLTAVGISYLANKLSEYPHARVILYVESDNVPALRTYSKLGFQISRTDTVYAMS